MSIEGTQWLSENLESSSEEDKDRKTKNKKNNKAADSRWVRPPLFGAELPKPGGGETKPILPPIPVEKLKETLAEVEEEDDEKKPESEETASVETTALASETDQQPTAAELLDIPHITDDKPYQQTFEEIMEQEMPPEFADATSGAELGDPTPSPAESQLAEPWESISGQSPFSSREETPTNPSPRTGSRSWWQPPQPIVRAETPPTSGEPESGPSAAGGPSPIKEILSSSGFSAALETLKAVSGLAEMAQNPYPMITRALTELAVKGFLAERKQQRYTRLERQLHQRDERIDQLQQQQRQANEQLATRLNQAEGTTKQPAEQRLVDQEGNEIVLQPGWHVKRSPEGSYSVVVDEHGRVVHDAIKYGEAFKRDQQREQLNDDLFNAISSGGAIGLPSTDQGRPTATQDLTSRAASNQSYGFQPLPSETVDLRHRLPRPHNLAKDTLTSPWLWTAVAILIIVYFVASLA